MDNLPNSKQLKALDAQGLKDVAGQLRSVIIDTVSHTGGHLASNLGSVELTLALHRALDLEQDKLIFDVGHQAYAHKLLTGRQGRFHTLRTQGGLSGFLRPDESKYDACISGHASTAISTALGMARARDLMGGSNQVVAVVGDGALTGGMCYEALNDAGNSGTRLIVVLNDNAMSISRNVGAMSGYLTNLRLSTPYRAFKRGAYNALGRLPHLGKGVLRVLGRGRDAMKALLVEGKFFEDLGFEYQGPIDGHNVALMEKVFLRAKQSRRPVLIHVVTHKGHGYTPAEKMPEQYHGVAPFFVESGKALQEDHISYGQVMCSQLCAMAERDSRICAITAAMPLGTGLARFGELYPKRLFDVGIAEEHALSMAAGLALSGMRPYVAIYSTFLQRAYDQILEDVCIQSLPVTLLIDRAGLVGSDGVTHQGVFDIAFLSQMPGMTVAAPRDQRDLKRLMELSLTMKGPLAIRYPRDAWDMGPGMQEKKPLKVGQWELLADGRDVMILAVGRMVERALALSIELSGRQVSCGVVDARFIKPMDEKMLSWAAGRAPLLVTLEEGVIRGGFGQQALGKLQQMGKNTPVLTLGVPDRFIHQGTVTQQMEDCGLSLEQMCCAVMEKLWEVRHGHTQN